VTKSNIFGELKKKAIGWNSLSLSLSLSLSNEQTQYYCHRQNNCQGKCSTVKGLKAFSYSNESR